MTKYDKAKYLVKQKARIRHTCYKCNACIEVGDIYYKEKIDVRPPPNLILWEYCIKCGVQE